MMFSEAKSRFEADVPQCPQCHSAMKVAFLVSGKRQDFVGYSCDCPPSALVRQIG
jgi:hypothetical protein